MGYALGCVVSGLGVPNPNPEPGRPARISPSAATIPPEMWNPDPPKGAITCGRCESWWTAPKAAHCGGCCETFATVRLFDLHRVDGACVRPGEVVSPAGERRLFFRNGMWRGPELTAEQRANLRERVWGGGADDAIPA